MCTKAASVKSLVGWLVILIELGDVIRVFLYIYIRLLIIIIIIIKCCGFRSEVVGYVGVCDLFVGNVWKSIDDDGITCTTKGLLWVVVYIYTYTHPYTNKQTHTHTRIIHSFCSFSYCMHDDRTVRTK